MDGLTTLAGVALHAPVQVIACRSEPTLRSRLATLGLRRGARVEAIQETPGGGRIVAVADSRIALGRSVLDALRVCPLEAAAA